MTPNRGQDARDNCAAAVNYATDGERTWVKCDAQDLADLIEQRDELLGALKTCLDAMHKAERANGYIPVIANASNSARAATRLCTSK